MSGNMKISVKDYGPIAEAKNIELCPLTVFVGPSNTGKSYLAILVYALLNSFEGNALLISLNGKIGIARQRSLDIDASSMNDDMTEWLKQVSHKKGIEDVTSLEIPDNVKNWGAKVIAENIKQRFHQELSRCVGMDEDGSGLLGKAFSVHLKDAKKELTLGLAHDSPSIKVSGVNFEGESLKNFVFTALEHAAKDLQGESSSMPLMSTFFIDSLLSELFGFGAKSLYLPAARTGIMQSHRAIMGNLVHSAAQRVGREPASVPALSGLLSDFLDGLAFMNTKRIHDAEVGKVAEMMEQELLQGLIQPKSSEHFQYPLFTYEHGGMEIPLLRASSMVTELAPILLFIKHRVSVGDLLIIEEPEAHLHPAAQVQMAEVIVCLIRAGVRVMVTTHSTDFLDALSNYVRKGQLKNRKNGELVLREQDLGAYVFNKHKEGTIVERLDFDKEAGISSDDHEAAGSALYNATANALQRLDDEEAAAPQ